MKALTLIGALLLALGLAGVIWGGVEMYDDRDAIEIGDEEIVLDDGDFPPIGIAGAIAAGIGLVIIVVGAATGPKD
jgi:hypothetical protein